MKKLFALLTLFLLSSFMLHGQETITIGTGTSRDAGPISGWYGYERNLMLYRADELSQGNILSMALQAPGNSYSDIPTRIYFKEVTWDNIPATSELIWNQLIADATLVYEGMPNITSGSGWHTIPTTDINTFTYSGAGNLLILIATDRTGSGGSSVNWRYETIGSSTNVIYTSYKQDGGLNDNVSLQTSYSTSTGLNNITSPTTSTGIWAPNVRWNTQFVIDPSVISCPRVSTLAVSDILSNNATVTWTPGSEETQWLVSYRKVSETTWSDFVLVENTPSYSFTATPLSSDTEYIVRVNALCGAGDTGIYRQSTFRTLISCHVPSNLSAIDSTITANGATLSWHSPSLPSATAYEDYTIEYKVSSSDWSTAVTIENVVDTFVNLTTLLPDTLYDARVRVNCTGDDNSNWITVTFRTLISCHVPSNLSAIASTITANGATLSWHSPSLPSTTAYEDYTVAYKVSGTDWSTAVTIENVVDTFVNLTTLLSNTLYDVRVRVNCTGDDNSNWITTTFRTACGTFAVPWSEDFNSYGTGTGVFPFCWERYNNGVVSTSYPYISNDQTHSAPGSMYFSYSNSLTLVTPSFEEDINTLMLTFWLMREGESSGTFSVGYLATPNDPSTFVALDTISNHPYNPDVWLEYGFFLTEAPAGVKQFAFRQNQILSNWFYWLDDIKVDYIPDCLFPSNITFHNITPTQVDVSFSPGNENDTVWYAYYRPVSSTGSWDSIRVTTNPFTISSLQLNTTYQFYMKTVCGDDFSNPSLSNITFTTPCDFIEIPYTQNFDGFSTGSSSATPCWTRLTNYSAGYPYISNSYYVSPSRSLYFYGYNTAYECAVAPVIDVTVNPINTLKVKFKVRTTTANASAIGIQIGVMTNPEDYTTFVPVGGYHRSSTTSAFEEKSVSLASYTGTGNFIVLRSTGTGNTTYSNTNYVDDFEILVIPACEQPDIATITPAEYSAEIAFTLGHTTDTAWYVYYKPLSATIWDSIRVTANPCTIDALQPGSNYQVYMKTDCSEELSLPSYTKTFRTLCAPIITLPFRESFEGYGTGESVMPACWTRMTTSTANRPYVNTSGVTGNCLYFYAGTAGYNLAVMPPLDEAIDISNLMISFDYKGYYTYDTLRIGVMTDATDANTFEEIAFVTGTTSWRDFEIFSSSYTGTGRFIAFKVNNPGSSYSYLDNLTIDTIPSCPRPVVVNVNPQGTSATASWTQIIDETQWLVSYKLSSASTWSNEELVSEPSYLMESLTELTSYEVRVRAYCGAGDTGNYRIATFFSGLIPAAIPFVENFETPTAWELINGTATNKWVIGADASANDNGGTQCLYITNNTTATPPPHTYNNSSASYVYAVKYINIEEVGNYLISYDWKADAEDCCDYIQVWLAPANAVITASTSSGPTTTNWINLYQSNLNGQTTWQTKELELTVSTTGVYKLVFYWKNDGSYGDDPPGTIDNISIINLSCPRPVVINIDPQGTSVTASWAQISDESQWLVSYKLSSASTWSDEVLVSESSYRMEPLIEATSYDIRVRAYCGEGDTSTYRTATFNSRFAPAAIPFTENFETPTVWELLNGTATNKWVIGMDASANDNGGAQCLYITNNTTATPPPYTYSHSTSHIYAVKYINIEEIGDYLINYNWKSQGESASYDYMRVWLAPGSATITAGSGMGYSPGTPSGYIDLCEVSLYEHSTWQTKAIDFTVSTTGVYKLVFYWYNDSRDGTPPPAAIDNISITKVTCSGVSDLTVDDLSYFDAEISWTPVGEDTAWLVSYRKASETTWSDWVLVENTPSYSFAATPLSSNTEYIVRVAALCEVGDTSFYRQTTFTTLISCPVPSNLSAIASTITATGATLSWHSPSLPPATAYEDYTVEYKVSGTDWSTAVTIENVVDTFVNLTTLLSNTLYDVRVRVNCTGDDNSSWITTTFRTACGTLAVPWSEDFNSYGTGSGIFPFCWERYNNGVASTSYPYISGGTSDNPPHSAPGTMYFSSSNSLTLVTPPFEEDINTLMLTFWLMKEGESSGTFSVGYLATPNDPSTFVALETISNHPYNPDVWLEYGFFLTEAPVGVKQFAFRQNQVSSSWYYWLDDIKVDYTPDCLFPSNITFNNITPNQVDVAFTPGNESDTVWYAYYRPASSTDTWDSIRVTTNPFTITSLQSATTYQIYMKTVCGDDFSNPSLPTMTFTTECGFIEIPYAQNFDGFSTGYSSATPCWTRLTNYYTQGYPYISNSYSVSPSNSLYFYGYYNTYECAVAPEIDVTVNPINTLKVKFKVRTTTANASAIGIQVGVMTDPEDYSTFVPVGGYHRSSTTTAFEEKSVSLISYTGTGNFIALRSTGTGNDTYYNYNYVDDFEILLIPDCEHPAITAITPTTYSAEIAFTLGHTTDTAWYVYYKPLSATVWDSVRVTANPCTITDLEPNTNYQVYMKTDCSEELSLPSYTETFRTLCTPVTTLPIIENFEGYGTGESVMPDCWTRITTSTADRPYVNTDGVTGNCLYFYAGLPGYNLAIMPPLDEAIDISNLMITFAYKGLYTYDTLRIGVMTDAANGNSFEEVAFVTGTNAWRDFEVFLSSYTGTGRFIAFKVTRSHNSYGYLDNLEINTAPVCDGPTNMQITTTANNMIEATWEGGPDDISWRYQLTDLTTGVEFSEQTLTLEEGPGYIFSGLQGGHEYQLCVKSECRAGLLSAEVCTTFRTPASEYTITVTREPANGGTVNPPGPVTLAPGSAQSFNITPGVNFTIEQVLLDGNVVSLTTGDTTEGVYTISNIRQNHLLHVRFKDHTGVDENNLSKEVMLYPNPAQNAIYIETQSLYKKVEIINVIGEVIYSGNVENMKFNLDVSGYASGLYLVRLYGDQGTATKKFVKE